MTPGELAAILTDWADRADADQRLAIEQDRIGAAARLRGEARAFRVAAAEIRKLKEDR